MERQLHVGRARFSSKVQVHSLDTTLHLAPQACIKHLLCRVRVGPSHEPSCVHRFSPVYLPPVPSVTFSSLFTI